MQLFHYMYNFLELGWKSNKFLEILKCEKLLNKNEISLLIFR